MGLNSPNGPPRQPVMPHVGGAVDVVAVLIDDERLDVDSEDVNVVIGLVIDDELVEVPLCENFLHWATLPQ